MWITDKRVRNSLLSLLFIIAVVAMGNDGKSDIPMDKKTRPLIIPDGLEGEYSIPPSTNDESKIIILKPITIPSNINDL